MTIKLPAMNAQSDEDLKERITTFLHQREEPPLRRLRVDVSHGTVIVSGRVRSYYQKQLVTACCQRVAGVHHVVNDVTVDDADGRPVAAK